MGHLLVADLYVSTSKNSAFLTSEKVEGRKTRSMLSIEKLERAIAVVEGSLADLAKDYASCVSLPHAFGFSRV